MWKNALERLISQGVIPVVNENDTVAIDELELEMGENDSLAAVVGNDRQCRSSYHHVRHRWTV